MEFKKKHEVYIKQKPIFNIYWKNKTQDQKEKEKELLKNDFGYDE